MTKNAFSIIDRCIPYSVNAMKLIMADRGMFVADFLLATTVPFFMQLLIWTYLFHENQFQAMGSMSLTQTLFYYALAIGFGRLNSGYDIIAGLSQVVREGSLEPHLLRPLPYPVQRLADFMGGGVLYTIPILITATLFVSNSKTSPSLLFWMGWALLLILSQILCFLLAWSVALMSFSFTRTDFALSLLTTSAAFFGGELLPPLLWPESLQSLMSYNPFRFMISAPAESLVRVDIHFLNESLIWCCGYVAVLTVLCFILWKRGIKKYRGAGG
jgi:ABC-2 type transport system permease protein